MAPPSCRVGREVGERGQSLFQGISESFPPSTMTLRRVRFSGLLSSRGGGRPAERRGGRNVGLYDFCSLSHETQSHQRRPPTTTFTSPTHPHSQRVQVQRLAWDTVVHTGGETLALLFSLSTQMKSETGDRCW